MSTPIIRTKDLLRALEYAGEENKRLREALEWYAEPVLAYAITQDREPRSAIHADGGKRARAALAPQAPPQRFGDGTKEGTGE